MSRSAAASLVRWALLLCALAAATGTRAATIVAGSTWDATTGAPLIGAQVSVRRGSEILGATVSGNDGAFRVPVELPLRPEAQNLKLFVARDAYLEAAQDVIVTAGRTQSPSYRFELMPKAVAACLRGRAHAVVVGHFRPAAGRGGDEDLSARIADALSYNLLTRLQQARLRPEAQPFVIACAGARPQSSADYGTFAKALQADAFLSGYVDEPRPGRAKVQMSVADRYGVLVPPARAASSDVDLNDPALARLDDLAHEAILVGLIAGYERAGLHADCIEAANAAERLLRGLPPKLAEARKRCQQASPNRALMDGGTR